MTAQYKSKGRSLRKKASTMNLRAQYCMESTELCRSLINNKLETRKARNLEKP